MHPALRSRLGGSPTPAWIADQVAALPTTWSEADVVAHLADRRVAVVEGLERRLADPPGPPSSPGPGELGPRRSASQQFLGAHPPGRSATSLSGVRHAQEPETGLAPRLFPLRGSLVATGYTPPGATYEKMRRMHAGSALPLYRDVASVADPVYRESYESWFERGWSPFYEKYAGPRSSELARLGAFFTSDEVAARAESFKSELDHFYADYPEQRTLAGQPVRASGVNPTMALTQASASITSGTPWWAWMLGAAFVGGLGWTILRQIRSTRKQKQRTRRRSVSSLDHILNDDSYPRMGQ